MHSDRLQPIYLIAAITLLLTATHAHRLLFVDAQSLITIVFRDTGPLAVALLIMGAVYWLYLKNLRATSQFRIFAWFVVGLITMGVIGFLIGITEQPSGGPVDLPYNLVLNTATAGAGFGLIIGSYDLRIRRRDQALLGLHENTQDLLEAKSKEEAGQVTVDTAQSILQLPLTGLWLRNEDVLEIVAMSDVAEQAFDIDLLLRVNAKESRHGISGWV